MEAFSDMLCQSSIPLTMPLSCSKVYGKVLVLDGVVRSTEKDERAINELMAHIPLFSHPHPQSVSELRIGFSNFGEF